MGVEAAIEEIQKKGKETQYIKVRLQYVVYIEPLWRERRQVCAHTARLGEYSRLWRASLDSSVSWKDATLKSGVLWPVGGGGTWLHISQGPIRLGHRALRSSPYTTVTLLKLSSRSTQGEAKEMRMEF